VSQDGSMLYMVHQAGTTLYLVGIQIDPFTSLFVYDIGNAGGTLGKTWAVRIPGSDSLIVTRRSSDSPGQAVVVRLDFDSGITSAPSEEWATVLTETHTEGSMSIYGREVAALAVDTDLIVAGYKSDWSDASNHLVTALNPTT